MTGIYSFLYTIPTHLHQGMLNDKDEKFVVCTLTLNIRLSTDKTNYTNKQDNAKGPIIESALNRS